MKIDWQAFRRARVARDVRFSNAREPYGFVLYVPLAQNVKYTGVMQRVEFQSHFISGLMLVRRCASECAGCCRWLPIGWRPRGRAAR